MNKEGKYSCMASKIECSSVWQNYSALITVGALTDALGFLLAAGGLLTTPKLSSLIVPASMFVQTGSCKLFIKFSKIALLRSMLSDAHSHLEFLAPALSGIFAWLMNSLPFRTYKKQSLCQRNHRELTIEMSLFYKLNLHSWINSLSTVYASGHWLFDQLIGDLSHQV